MNLTMHGGTSRQRAWFQAALDAATYPFDALDATVDVSWVAEPSCPGHSEYACTFGNSSGYTVQIRETLDSTVSRAFYMETCMHELGHVVMFSKGIGSGECSWFQRKGGGRHGSADDLDPMEKAWENRIQEGMAETFKDVFLAKPNRAFDNRTYWWVDQNFFSKLMMAILPPADPGQPPGHFDNTVYLGFVGETEAGGHLDDDTAYVLGETLDRPYPGGEEWFDTYTFSVPSLGVPSDATNVHAHVLFNGSSQHFPQILAEGDHYPPRSFGDAGIAATYEFDTVASNDFNDTQIGAVFGNAINLYDSTMTVGMPFLSGGNNTIPWAYAREIPLPAAGNHDCTFWSAKGGVDSPWPWTSYNPTLNGPNAPRLRYTYDTPGVPPTPSPDVPPWPYVNLQSAGSPPPGKRVPGRRVSGGAASNAAVKRFRVATPWRFNKN